MKKIILFLIFYILAFNLFSNEKITEIKFEKHDTFRFYLVDENGNKNYGYYDGSGYFKKISVLDNTKDSFYGKVSKQDLNELYRRKLRFRWNALGFGLNIGFGLFFTSLGVLGIVFYKTLSTLSWLVLSGITTSCGGTLLILGITSAALMGFNAYKYRKAKEKIIEVLNWESASLSNKKVKINFVVNLTL